MSRLLPLVLLAGLTSCTSLDSAFDSASNLLSPSSGSSSSSSESAEGGKDTAEAQNAAAQPEGEKDTARQSAQASAQPAAAQPRSEQVAPAGAEPAAAPPAARQEGATQTASSEAGEQSGEASGEASANGEADINGRRTITVPKGGGASAEVKRRLDSLFGGATSTSASIEPTVKESEIVGAWLLEEEDGLRNCTITLTSPDKGGVVSGGAECSGLAAQVTGWGMFGNDLLLHDADNTVRARLRRSDAGWIGFTLETGIPLVMSRSG